MTRYVIYDARTNKEIIGSAKIANAAKILEKLNAKYGNHYVIRKVGK